MKILQGVRKLLKKYESEILKSSGNIYHIRIGTMEFHYDNHKHIIKLSDSDEWFNKPISYLNQIFNNNIPLREYIYVFDFGKYIGKSFNDIENTDVSYIVWCLDNIAGFRIKYKEYKKTNSFDELMDELAYKLK
jgi:hypothetical protein